MDNFEELVAEMKGLYSHLASLSQGVQQDGEDGSGGHGGAHGHGGGGDGNGDGDSTNIVRDIFDTICDSEDGTISRSDLSAAFTLFDETSIDPGFAERTMQELLPGHITYVRANCSFAASTRARALSLSVCLSVSVSLSPSLLALSS
jgi:hypothetical protein